MMITTDSPRLTVTPGEWYGSDAFTQTRHELRHTCDISAAADCNAVTRNDLIFRWLSLPPEDVSAGRDGTYDFPKTDCAAADSGADEMNDQIFRRLILPPEDDSAAFGLDDPISAGGIFRRKNSPPEGILPRMPVMRGNDFPPHELYMARPVD